jgi:hypothetical protein
VSPDSEPLLTVAQVAKMLGVSRDTVRRRYRHRDGVLKYGHPETPIHRQYISLRIPAKTVHADIARMSGNLEPNHPESSVHNPPHSCSSDPSRRCPHECRITNEQT